MFKFQKNSNEERPESVFSRFISGVKGFKERVETFPEIIGSRKKETFVDKIRESYKEYYKPTEKVRARDVAREATGLLGRARKAMTEHYTPPVGRIEPSRIEETFRGGRRTFAKRVFTPEEEEKKERLKQEHILNVIGATAPLKTAKITKTFAKQTALKETHGRLMDKLRSLRDMGAGKTTVKTAEKNVKGVEDKIFKLRTSSGIAFGIEKDEEGKFRISPEKAAMGVFAMGGMKAMRGRKITAQYPSMTDRLLRFGKMRAGEMAKKLRIPALSKQRLDKLASPSYENFNDYSKTKKLIKGKWTTKIREWGQDKMIRVKKLIESPEVKVSEKTDPYLAETLFHGRVASRLENIKKSVRHIDADIVKTAKSFKTKSSRLLENVNRYLVARHAPERNLKLGEKAAGITTKQAKEVMSVIEGSVEGKEIRRIADDIGKLNKQTLDTLHEGEVISEELYNLLRKTYKHHIPLNRILDETGDIAKWLTGGKGFSVKGTGLIRAKGSQLKVADIMENVTANVEQAVVRAEKNRIGLSVLRFAKDNKMVGGLFKIVKPKAIGKTFEGKLITERITDPLVLAVREKGKPVYLKINDEALAGALQGINAEHLPHGFKWINSITRFYSSLATRYNPEFAFSNVIRDMQENMVYMAAQKNIGFKGSAKTPIKLAGSAKDIISFMRGKKTSGAKLYEQMVKDGGTTGGMALSTKKQIQIDLDKIRKINRSTPRKATEKLLRGIDNWNQVFEDASRLSSYKVALGKGFSRARAAQISKEATVNFNRKGTAGPIINALYMFSNASIQGSTKMLIAMKNPKVAAAVVSSVTIPVIAVNQWNDSIDPNWREKVTDWDRVSNLPVLIPQEEGTRYATMPVSWGLKPIMAMVNISYDMAVGKDRGAKDSMEKIITSITESYNPLGGSDLFSAFMPTVGDIPSDVARNKAWYGAPIMPDYKKELPRSERYFKSIEKTAIGRTSKKIAEKLSTTTNRTVEISPENIDYAFNQIVSGAGKFVNKTINLVSSIGKEEKPRPQELPVISRFLKERSEEETARAVEYKKQDTLFDRLRKMETGSEEQKGVIKDYLRGLPSDEAREKAHWNIREGGFSVTGIRKSGAMLELEPLYERAQKFFDEGDKQSASELWKGLNKEQKETYKKILSSEKSKRTRKFKELLLSDPAQAVNYMVGLREDQKQSLVNVLKRKENKELKRIYLEAYESR